MFKLFGAIGKMFRAMLYTLAGDVSKWSEVWETNPGYVRAEYEEIVKDHMKSINETTDAVAGIMEINTQKQHNLETINKQCEDLKRKQLGAQAKAKKQVEKLQAEGKSMAEIQADPDVLKCSGFYEDFTSSLANKEEEAQRLESEIEKHEADLSKYKNQLSRMHAELKRIKQEKHETIADLEIAKQEEKVNQAILGVSESKTEERRQRIQELRRKRRAKADITAEMAGLETEDAEQEFLDYATTSEAQSDFFGSIGIGNEFDKNLETTDPEVKDTLGPSGPQIPEE
jgi:DNA repair exonuclease SbcCD ATPase subunit